MSDTRPQILRIQGIYVIIMLQILMNFKDSAQFSLIFYLEKEYQLRYKQLIMNEFFSQFILKLNNEK